MSSADVPGMDGTFTSPDFTFSYSKFSCWRTMYFAHVFFCYLLFLAGIGCFVTRLVQPVKWTHVWFGRVYIISMLWATATSLLIHNTGLPTATLISFVFVLGGMSIGYIIIQFYTTDMQRKATRLVQANIAEQGLKGDLGQMINKAKGEIAAKKTFVQRFFSLKAAHGIIMFCSWFNVAGRIFASNQSGDFTCHTYPVYKPINTPDGQYANKPLTLVPVRDPNFDRLPWAKTGLWGWSMGLGFGTIIAAAVVGALFSFFAARFSARRMSRADVKDLYNVPAAAA